MMVSWCVVSCLLTLAWQGMTMEQCVGAEPPISRVNPCFTRLLGFHQEILEMVRSRVATMIFSKRFLSSDARFIALPPITDSLVSPPPLPFETKLIHKDHRSNTLTYIRHLV